VIVRFQADADLKHAIVRAILRRESTVDFQSASVGGLGGLNDLEVLAVAARDGRVLVSHDKQTMPDYFSEFVEKSTSSGVVIASQSLPIGLVVEELLLIWSASDSEEWINRIVHLPL
jgi:hypothetical protein